MSWNFLTSELLIDLFHYTFLKLPNFLLSWQPLIKKSLWEYQQPPIPPKQPASATCWTMLNLTSFTSELSWRKTGTKLDTCPIWTPGTPNRYPPKAECWLLAPCHICHRKNKYILQQIWWNLCLGSDVIGAFKTKRITDHLGRGLTPHRSGSYGMGPEFPTASAPYPYCLQKIRYPW